MAHLYSRRVRKDGRRMPRLGWPREANHTIPNRSTLVRPAKEF